MPIKWPRTQGRGGPHIPPLRLPIDDPNVQFSFKLLDLRGNPKFGVHHCRDGYLEKLLERFRDVNRMRVREFRSSYTSAVRNHRIDFAETSEPDGFNVNEQLRGEEFWQFEITSNEHDRVHGILISEVFHVIWLDPCHKLYGPEHKCGH